MGIFMDYEYRMGGSNKAKMKKALKHIRQLQVANAQYSGNGVCEFSNPPQVRGDGLMQWSCFCKAIEDGPPDVLRKQLISLTRGRDFHFWFYSYCTDGCNESSLEHHQDGECAFDNYWNSGILGLDNSIAMAKLEDCCDADAAHSLMDSFLVDCHDEWDEDFFDDMQNACLAATSLSVAVRRWPTLLAEHFIQSKLADISRKLAVLCEGAREFGEFDLGSEDRDDLHALQAVLEAEILKQGTLVPPPGNTPATAGVRL